MVLKKTKKKKKLWYEAAAADKGPNYGGSLSIIFYPGQSLRKELM